MRRTTSSSSASAAIAPPRYRYFRVKSSPDPPYSVFSASKRAHRNHQSPRPTVSAPPMADKLKLHLVSACEGLGTAGDACPIVLPCDRQPWTGARGATCAVEPLPGYGYNPSAIPAPAFVKSLAQAAGYNVTYLGTTRKWRWSRHCQNEYTRRGDNGPGGLSGRPERSSSTATDVLLLGGDLRVLGRVPLVGGHCMQHNHAAEDARLLRVGEREVWASYVAFNHPDPRCAGGHWMARLAFSVAGAARRPRLHVSLEQTETSCGVGLSLAAGTPLWSTRNAGLIVRKGVIAFELVRTSPVTEVVRAADSSRISHPAPPSLYGYSEHPNKVLSEWHNSINPLWIPELDGGCYLGVAHRHYLSRPTDAAVRRGVDQFKGVHGDTTARLGMAAHAHEPSDLVWQRARHWATKPMYGANGTVFPPQLRPQFPFGWGYRRVLYTLTPQFRIRRHSKEFCLPSLSGSVDESSGSPTACEAVQYVSSALRISSDAVALLYGVNDCTSARVTFSLAQLDSLLEYTYDPPE